MASSTFPIARRTHPQSTCASLHVRLQRQGHGQALVGLLLPAGCGQLVALPVSRARRATVWSDSRTNRWAPVPGRCANCAIRALELTPLRLQFRKIQAKEQVLGGFFERTAVQFGIRFQVFRRDVSPQFLLALQPSRAPLVMVELKRERRLAFPLSNRICTTPTQFQSVEPRAFAHFSMGGGETVSAGRSGYWRRQQGAEPVLRRWPLASK